ncbi:uncharacterized protein LOC141907609 isoform X2 [Tubulanus polymorphus]
MGRNAFIIIFGLLEVMFGMLSIVAGAVEIVVYQFNYYGAFEFWAGICDIVVGAFCVYAACRVKRTPAGIAMGLSIVLAVLSIAAVVLGSLYFYFRMRNAKGYCDSLDYYQNYQTGVSSRSLKKCEEFYVAYGMLVMAMCLAVIVFIMCIVQAGFLYAWRKAMNRERQSNNQRPHKFGISSIQDTKA